MLIPDKGFLCYEDSETGTLAPICEEVRVVEQSTHLLNGDILLKVELFLRTAVKRFQIERGELEKGVPRKFFDQGLTMLPVPENSDALVEFLLDAGNNAPLHYYHDRLGFCNYQGKQVFLADRPIGINNKEKRTSHYLYPEKTAPKGDFAAWKSLITDDVVGHINIELALSLGVTAPVAHLLREQRAIASVPIWAIVGDSSTGKTSMMKLMASIFGSPDESDGLIEDLNATRNGFEASMQNNSGFPILIDEATIEPDWGFDKVIYTMPKGRGKKRANQTGNLILPVRFSGAIIISSEKPLIRLENAPAGMYARFTEFSLPWADSAEHINHLIDGVNRNYGTAVYPLIEWLLTHKDELAEAYKMEYDNLIKVRHKLYIKELRKEAKAKKIDVPNDDFEEYAKTWHPEPNLTGIEDRLYKMYAIITLSAMIAQCAWDIPFSINEIRLLLLNLHNSQLPPMTPAEIAYNKIIAGVASNASKFLKTQISYGSLPHSCDIWGEFGHHHGQSCVWIVSEKLKFFLGIKPDEKISKSLLNELEISGKIVRLGDRYVDGHTIGNIRPKCYCVLCSSFGTVPNPSDKKPTVISQRSLLNDEDETDCDEDNILEESEV